MSDSVYTQKTKYALNARGLTANEVAEQLASILELPPSELVQILNSQTAPDFPILYQLAKALNIPLTWFTRGFDEEGGGVEILKESPNASDNIATRTIIGGELDRESANATMRTIIEAVRDTRRRHQSPENTQP